MQRIDLCFEIRDDLRVHAPRIRTDAGWVTIGVGETLEAASGMAMREMLDLLEATHAVPRAEALALASVAVDLRITQLVNGVVGVHAVLPDDGLC